MSVMARKSVYDGDRIAFLTKHGKDRALAPIFAERLGAALDVTLAFDTDLLGTFSGEVPRAGTQLEAARTKARLAKDLCGAEIGLGSEGAFSPGPLGFGVRNFEVLVLVDSRLEIEVAAGVDAPGLHWQQQVSSSEELAQAARSAGFPEHGLAIRAEPNGIAEMGIKTWPELIAAFERATKASRDGRAIVENDLRANQHPSRMAAIGRAGEELVKRLLSICPECAWPGFGAIGVDRGLPCGDCGEPTAEPIADELGCVKCDKRLKRKRDGPQFANPERCERCNP